MDGIIVKCKHHLFTSRMIMIIHIPNQTARYTTTMASLATYGKLKITKLMPQNFPMIQDSSPHTKRVSFSLLSGINITAPTKGLIATLVSFKAQKIICTSQNLHPVVWGTKLGMSFMVPVTFYSSY